MGRLALIAVTLALFPLAAVAQPEPPAKKPAGKAGKVYDFREQAAVGDYKVSVRSAMETQSLLLSRIIRPDVVTRGVTSIRLGRGFLVSVQVENSTKDRKLDWTTWRTTAVSDAANRASLTDGAGSSYKAHVITFDFAPDGSPADEASIYPGKSITEQLYFEIPVEDFKVLYLTLPKANIGSDGSLRFAITDDDVFLSANGLRRAEVDAARSASSKPEPAMPVAPVKPAAPAATHAISGTARKPVVAGKTAKHVEDYERLEFGDAAEAKAAAKLVADGSVILFAGPTPVAADGAAFKGWVYVRPTDGPHKGKLLAVREAGVGAAK